MNAVVLAFDRLNVSLLGCYGNLEAETPHFDRLAAESVVFNQHYGENFDADAVNHAWWTGCYQFPRSHEEQRQMPAFLPVLRDAGVRRWLVRDRSSPRPPWALCEPYSGFDEVEEVDISSDCGSEDFGGSFSAVVDRATSHLHRLYDSKADRVLLWVSVSGLSMNADPSCDPNSTGLHAQMTRIDEMLGHLLDAIAQGDAPAQPLLIVTAAAGVRLPQRDGLDERSVSLNDCLIHTPLLIRPPSTEKTGSRRQQLVQTVDLVPSLLDWFGIKSAAFTTEGRSWLPLLAPDRVAWRDALFLGDATRVCGVRTADFWFVDTAVGSDPSPTGDWLFVKPEDIWDMHDVAQQVPGEVSRLSAALRQFVADPRAARAT